jgi:hypothetical protein
MNGHRVYLLTKFAEGLNESLVVLTAHKRNERHTMMLAKVAQDVIDANFGTGVEWEGQDLS